MPESPFGAVRLGYARQAEAAVELGVALEVVTQDRLPVVRRFAERLKVFVLPFAAAWWLWRRRRQYDVALFHSYAGWVFNLLPRRPPTITAFHGLEPLAYEAIDADHRTRGRRLTLRYRLVHGWLMRRLLRSSCRRSVGVLCLNLDEGRYLVEQGWTTPNRLVVFRHGVPEFFFVDDRAYAPRATRLLFVSQWLTSKGTPYLVEAFAAAARAHPDLRLICCGTLVDEAAVQAEFPPDVRARVVVKPTLTRRELAAVARDADIFIHAAHYEAFGNAIAEAMAGALPIVVTPVGVARDLLEHERDCLIVPKSDSRSLADAIHRLIDDAGLRRRLGTAARQAAEQLRAEERERTLLTALRTAAGRPRS